MDWKNRFRLLESFSFKNCNGGHQRRRGLEEQDRFLESFSFKNCNGGHKRCRGLEEQVQVFRKFLLQKLQRRTSETPWIGRTEQVFRKFLLQKLQWWHGARKRPMEAQPYIKLKPWASAPGTQTGRHRTPPKDTHNTLTQEIPDKENCKPVTVKYRFDRFGSAVHRSTHSFSKSNSQHWRNSTFTSKRIRRPWLSCLQLTAKLGPQSQPPKSFRNCKNLRRARRVEQSNLHRRTIHEFICQPQHLNHHLHCHWNWHPSSSSSSETAAKGTTCLKISTSITYSFYIYHLL